MNSEGEVKADFIMANLFAGGRLDVKRSACKITLIFACGPLKEPYVKIKFEKFETSVSHSYELQIG